MVYELATRGSILVFSAQTNWARSIGSALLDRLDYARLSDEPIPESFRHAQDRAAPLAALAVAREWLGERSLIARLLERGIGVHYGRLPDAVREAIEEDFRARRISVMIATSTLAQGVNLPVRTVVFHSCWRSDEQTRTRLSAREYWNIAGRAGRAGEETEGTVIHIVASPSDASDLDFYLRHRASVEDVESTLYTYLSQLVEGRLSPQVVGDALDSEILAILAEEGEADLGSAMEDVLRSSLCNVQAVRNGAEVLPLARAFEQKARNIAAQVVDVPLRRVFSATGFSTASCEAMRQHIVESAERLTALFDDPTAESQKGVLQTIIANITTLEEMADANGYAGDFGELVQQWVDGLTVSELADDMADGSSDDVARTIEQVLTYLLPWGCSAYLRIARAVLERDIPSSVSAIPAMLKYGVPNMEAAWIQGAGVRGRQLSIALAQRYRATDNPRTADAVRRWLSALDPEDLVTEYGAQPHIAAAAARAIFRSTRNHLLDAYETDSLLPYDVDIGVGRRALESGEVHSLKAGDRMSLIRDYASTINRNSVAVFYADRRIGYLPWQLSEVLAVEMDAGQQFPTEVIVQDGGTLRVRVDKIRS
jgi:hypothetical protein